MSKRTAKIIVVTATMISCAAGIYAQARGNGGISAAEDHYLQGKEFLLKGDYEKANEAFKKAEAALEGIKPAPRPVIPLADKAPPESAAAPAPVSVDPLQQAAAAYARGNLRGALRFYQKALEKYPRNYNIHYNLGVIYLRGEDYARATDEFEKVIASNKKDAAAYYNLGVLYENFLGNRKQALIYYRKYLIFARKGREKTMVKGWIEYIKGQLD
jgi:tetratricopeptide (TPR) repeat protein